MVLDKFILSKSHLFSNKFFFDDVGSVYGWVYYI